MQSMSQMIIRLELAARRTAISKRSDDGLSLKIKLLLLLSQGINTPPELTSALSVNKSNLALMTSQLVKEGLITKRKHNVDRREISILITDEGQHLLDSSLLHLEQACETAFGAEYEAACRKLFDALETLELI